MTRENISKTQNGGVALTSLQVLQSTKQRLSIKIEIHSANRARPLPTSRVIIVPYLFRLASERLPPREREVPSDLPIKSFLFFDAQTLGNFQLERKSLRFVFLSNNVHTVPTLNLFTTPDRWKLYLRFAYVQKYPLVLLILPFRSEETRYVYFFALCILFAKNCKCVNDGVWQ